MSESSTSTADSPATLSPADYLETYVFPSLLPAIEDLLKHVSPQPPTSTTLESNQSLNSPKDVTTSFNTTLSPILFLAQHLSRHNPRKSSGPPLTTSFAAKIPIPSSTDDLR